MKWHTGFNDSLNKHYGGYATYYPNGNLEYGKSVIDWEPDTVEVVYDSIANQIFIRATRKTGKRKAEENTYHFDGYKNFRAINTTYNKRKRVERHYHPNGDLYKKCVYRKGKLRRERHY